MILDPIDPLGGPAAIELIFPDLEDQPASFAINFIKALDQTCRNLDAQVLATFLFNEPYVASMDLVPFLRGLDTLIWYAKEEGAHQMIPRPIRCAHCKPGVGGVAYTDPAIPEEEEVGIAFIFVEEEGKLKEVLECRAVCRTA
ncbi:MAG: hypothetical protein IPJ06_00285 [Saprospiraceae bacterium]|nr:hypothetical protein [Saprospiraceae bacterium]